MSKNIVDLIKFRQSALDNSSKDDVLEISHLFRDSIDPERFFSESYFTEGIDVLLKTAFARFAGQDDHGVVKLTQNMGGGKTHSMITLGLLAKHPEHRKRFLGDNSFEGDVRVIGFTGRQTDTNLGIWGELAKQLGKEEDFKEYYNPQFAAPGSEAWITMLQGAPTLILLDEIPPYLVNAKSKTVGNSDLSQVTGIALSNLFNALNDSRLANVLIVVADLAGSHAEGSEMIKEVIKNLGSEMRRVSLDLTPVNNQSNELVEILKTKLIEVMPSEDAIREVADEYKKVLTEAKQMGLVNVEPAQFASLIVKNYPFHPSFIDLYNRFKENEGFQQTRGVIRLVRSMVQDIHETKANLQLISPQDINLSNQRLRTEIEQLNPSLAPATRHDIHNLDGNSVAQLNSAKRGDVLVEDVARLLLVSSLSSVPNGLKGLNETEITAIIARPGVKVTDIRSAREQLYGEAWYLATDKDNRLFFQQNQNLNAQLKALVESYDEESARKEVRAYLESELKPTVGDLYQKVQVFPGIEEFDINAKQVTLIVTEPSHFEEGLSHEVRQYWSEHSYKNRFLFMSGERQTWDSLIEAFKELKAVNTVISVMIDERASESDPQYKKAIDKRDKTYIQITSAVRETFITLYFPRGDNSGDRLDKTEISFQFTGNNFDAEKQIRAALIEERKFSTSQDIESASFRDKVEERLFGSQQKEINWNDLLNNAAANCSWSWHLTEQPKFRGSLHPTVLTASHPYLHLQAQAAASTPSCELVEVVIFEP
ncbi:ATP-binding protein [Candidatus Saccharibacteria bacterium]|nr:MAG: ATP-binding protein [Candidatus Saccharibacteria bacterium]